VKGVRGKREIIKNACSKKRSRRVREKICVYGKNG